MTPRPAKALLPVTFGLIGSLFLLSLYSSDGAEKKAKQPVKPYRVIFNFDTSGIIGQGFKVIGSAKTPKEYLETTYGHPTYAPDNLVDAVFWHDGANGNVANWDSEVLEKCAERIGKVSPVLLKLIEEGNDPPKVAVRESKKRGKDVFYSFRLNDVHDSGPSHLVQGYPQLLATFKVEHPEWTIGKGGPAKRVAEGQPYGGHRSLNFAIVEVRDLKFAVVEEVFRKFDFDGLELDFLRSPPYFMPGEEPTNAPVMTQFVRRIRNHLNERGKERGRPITLAARVDESLNSCRLDGFDVTTWIKEGLIDIIILGSGAFDIEIEVFKKLAEGTDVLVYPCLYGAFAGYRPISVEMARAQATNYWFQGADGIYLFSYGPLPFQSRLGDPTAKLGDGIAWYLTDIGNPKALRGKDKFFMADRGSPLWQYPHNWLHCVVPMELKGEQRVDVPVMVGEDFTQAPRPKNISFRFVASDITGDDALELKLNGSTLPALQESGKWQRKNLGPSRIWQSATRWTKSVQPEELKVGRNKVAVSLSKGVMTIRGVEIYVTYE